MNSDLIINTLLGILESLDRVTENEQRALVATLAKMIASYIDEDERIERLYVAFASDNLDYLIEQIAENLSTEDVDNV